MAHAAGVHLDGPLWAARTMGVISLMAILVNPEVVETNRYLVAVYAWLEFDSTQAFHFFLGLESESA